jgi:hypothetical protein
MKKLGLKMQGAGNVLSAEQMKKVVGGYGGCPSTGCTIKDPNGTSYSGTCNTGREKCICRVELSQGNWKQGDC